MVIMESENDVGKSIFLHDIGSAWDPSYPVWEDHHHHEVDNWWGNHIMMAIGSFIFMIIISWAIRIAIYMYIRRRITDAVDEYLQPFRNIRAQIESIVNEATENVHSSLDQFESQYGWTN